MRGAPYIIGERPDPDVGKCAQDVGGGPPDPEGAVFGAGPLAARICVEGLEGAGGDGADTPAGTHAEPFHTCPAAQPGVRTLLGGPELPGTRGFCGSVPVCVRPGGATPGACPCAGGLPGPCP
jgi:hypothetical protein